MKQINIINAYKNLEQLSMIKDYHNKEQWALYKLRKELRSYNEFYQERNQTIIDKYRQYANEEGVISGQPYQDYLKDVEELNNLDVDIKIEKISLPFVDGITFVIAEQLEDFIEFTE